MLTTNIDIADTTVYGQMETVVKIYLDRITQKPNSGIYKCTLH